MSRTTEPRVDATATSTYIEITRQPRVWRELATALERQADETQAFLGPLLAREDLRLVLTGAGTSAFVGDVAAPALARTLRRRVEAVPTTTIVSNPREVFAHDVPTVLVSFARSGNSPESIAATDLADSLLTEVHHVVITCASDGTLALRHTPRPGSLVVLMPPDSNDSGFAMTAAFTCMLLACLVLFRVDDVALVRRLADVAETIIARQEAIAALARRGDHRIVYLGSGPLAGLAQEASLKVLELTAGEVAAFHDSSLGFRHGPKAVVDPSTLVVVFVSGEEYTRSYDLDIIAELRGDRGDDAVLALAPTDIGTDAWVVPDLAEVPDAFAAAVYVIVAQYLGLFASAALGKTPDNPFPAGDVNRVVRGVVIHDVV